jgi:hypothetical protein
MHPEPVFSMPFLFASRAACKSVKKMPPDFAGGMGLRIASA